MTTFTAASGAYFLGYLSGLLKKFRLTKVQEKDRDILTLANLDSGYVRRFVVHKVDEQSLASLGCQNGGPKRPIKPRVIGNFMSPLTGSSPLNSLQPLTESPEPIDTIDGSLPDHTALNGGQGVLNSNFDQGIELNNLKNEANSKDELTNPDKKANKLIANGGVKLSNKVLNDRSMLTPPVANGNILGLSSHQRDKKSHKKNNKFPPAASSTSDSSDDEGTDHDDKAELRKRKKHSKTNNNNNSRSSRHKPSKGSDHKSNRHTNGSLPHHNNNNHKSGVKHGDDFGEVKNVMRNIGEEDPGVCNPVYTKDEEEDYGKEKQGGEEKNGGGVSGDESVTSHLTVNDSPDNNGPRYYDTHSIRSLPANHRSGYQSGRSSVTSQRKGILKKSGSCVTINLEAGGDTSRSGPGSVAGDDEFDGERGNHQETQRSMNRVKFILDSGKPDNINGSYDDIRIEMMGNNRMDREKSSKEEEQKGMSHGTRKMIIAGGLLLLLGMVVAIGAYVADKGSTTTGPLKVTASATKVSYVKNTIEVRFIVANGTIDSEYFTKNVTLNLEKELTNILVAKEVGHGNMDLVLKVKDIDRHSLRVTSIIGWEFFDPDSRPPPPVNNSIIERRLKFHLLTSEGIIGEFLVESPEIRGVEDKCAMGQMDCKGVTCSFNYKELEFKCECIDHMVWNEEQKKCAKTEVFSGNPLLFDAFRKRLTDIGGTFVGVREEPVVIPGVTTTSTSTSSTQSSTTASTEGSSSSSSESSSSSASPSNETTATSSEGTILEQPVDESNAAASGGDVEPLNVTTTTTPASVAATLSSENVTSTSTTTTTPFTTTTPLSTTASVFVGETNETRVEMPETPTNASSPVASTNLEPISNEIETSPAVAHEADDSSDHELTNEVTHVEQSSDSASASSEGPQITASSTSSSQSSDSTQSTTTTTAIPIVLVEGMSTGESAEAAGVVTQQQTSSTASPSENAGVQSSSSVLPEVTSTTTVAPSEVNEISADTSRDLPANDVQSAQPGQESSSSTVSESSSSTTPSTTSTTSPVIADTNEVSEESELGSVSDSTKESLPSPASTNASVELTNEVKPADISTTSTESTTTSTTSASTVSSVTTVTSSASSLQSTTSEESTTSASSTLSSTIGSKVTQSTTELSSIVSTVEDSNAGDTSVSTDSGSPSAGSSETDNTDIPVDNSENSIATLVPVDSGNQTSSPVSSPDSMPAVVDSAPSQSTPVQQSVLPAVLDSEVTQAVEDHNLSSTSTTEQPNEVITCSEGEHFCDGKCLARLKKCDSIKDCSDNSDEEDCVSNKCFENFQCWTGHCVPRRNVCDGVTDCVGGDDELACNTWHCLDDEFRCTESFQSPEDVPTNSNSSMAQGPCLPKSLRCDGQPDCFNHTDERGCIAEMEECDASEFRCPEGWCIPNGWKCDGVPDCEHGEDEQHCSCNGLDVVSCNMGGCVPTFKLCDGLRECPDGSDEWGCVRLQNTTRRLEVRSGQSWRMVCGDGWTFEWSDFVCEQLVGSKSVSNEVRRYEKDGSEASSLWNRPKVKLVADASARSRSPVQYALREECSSETLVHLECQEDACGDWADLIPEGAPVIGTLPSHWPSMAFLLHKPSDEASIVSGGSEGMGSTSSDHPCTASVLSALWLVASYTCLASQHEGLLPESWAVVTGEGVPHIDGSKAQQKKLVRQIIKYPGLKRQQGYWTGDLALLRLESPLTIDKFTRPVCIPPEDTPAPTGTCVVVSWSSNADSAGSLSLHQTAADLTSLSSCNSTHYHNRLSSTHVCADLNEDIPQPCHGVEGSPLMCQTESGLWQAGGLLTHYSDCGTSNHPAIFTSLKSWNTWIINTIGRTKYYSQVGHGEATAAAASNVGATSVTTTLSTTVTSTIASTTPSSTTTTVSPPSTASPSTAVQDVSSTSLPSSSQTGDQTPPVLASSSSHADPPKSQDPAPLPVVITAQSLEDATIT